MIRVSFVLASICHPPITRGWRIRTDDHHPLPLETSVPGVFAIGDARASSTKRVAAAVGEGAAAVAQVHTRLASQKTIKMA